MRVPFAEVRVELTDRGLRDLRIDVAVAILTISRSREAASAWSVRMVDGEGRTFGPYFSRGDSRTGGRGGAQAKHKPKVMAVVPVGSYRIEVGNARFEAGAYQADDDSFRTAIGNVVVEVGESDLTIDE